MVFLPKFFIQEFQNITKMYTQHKPTQDHCVHTVTLMSVGQTNLSVRNNDEYISSKGSIRTKAHVKVPDNSQCYDETRSTFLNIPSSLNFHVMKCLITMKIIYLLRLKGFVLSLHIFLYATNSTLIKS